MVPPGGHCMWASLHWANAHPMWTLSKCFMWTQFSPTLLVSMGFKSLVTCTVMFLGYLPPHPSSQVGGGRGLGFPGPRHLCSRTVGFRRQNSPSLRQAWALVEARSSTGTAGEQHGRGFLLTAPGEALPGGLLRGAWLGLTLCLFI